MNKFRRFNKFNKFNKFSKFNKLRRRGVSIRKMGIRWISDRRIGRIVGEKNRLIYKRVILIRNIVKRWFFIKDYLHDLLRSRRVRNVKYLLFKEVKNNIMGTLVDGRGQVLVKKSSGEVGFSGSKRNSSIAASTLGDSIGKLVWKRGIRGVSVRVKGRISNKFKLFLRSFFRNRVRVRRIEVRVRHLHQSFKLKKTRRI